MWSPAISRPAGASAISARASSGAKPNFEPAWPVRIASCVSASTPGVTRRSTRCVASAEQLREPQRLLPVVEHDRADPGVHGHRQLRARLGVAVQVDALGREAGVQREVQLAARGDVAAEPLLGEQPQHGRARQRLGGEHDLAGPVVVGGQGVAEGAGAGAQVVLGEHVGGRAVLARDRLRVAAADQQPAVADLRGLGQDVDGGGGHAARDYRVTPAGVRCACARAASRRRAPDRGGWRSRPRRRAPSRARSAAAGSGRPPPRRCGG